MKRTTLLTTDELIENSLKLIPQQYIDYALETNNKELFDEVVEKYGLSVNK